MPNGELYFQIIKFNKRKKTLWSKKLDNTAGQIVPCKWGGQRVCLMSNCIRTDAYQRRTYQNTSYSNHGFELEWSRNLSLSLE